LGSSLAVNSTSVNGPGASWASASNRTALNNANVQTDPDYYGSGAGSGGQAWVDDVAARTSQLLPGTGPNLDAGTTDELFASTVGRQMSRITAGYMNEVTSGSTPAEAYRAGPDGLRAAPYAPLQPGVYNYQEWTNELGLNKTWTDYPDNVNLIDAAGNRYLPGRNVVLESGGSLNAAQGNASDSTNPYYMAPGFIATSYQQGVSMMRNGNLPASERFIGGAAATLMAPMMLFEEAGRGLINAPGQIYSAGVNASRVYTAPTVEGKVVAGLTAMRDGAFGVLGLAPLLPAKMMMPTPVLTAQEMAVAQFPGAQATAAARATYLGDVYSPEFVGPVQWKYFYRGDATARTDFLSPMAQERGVQATTEFLDSRASGTFGDIYAEHGVSSHGDVPQSAERVS
jgi:hypothetical protein